MIFVNDNSKVNCDVLRHLGFKTFSQFIDESYDDEPNESKRVNMVYNEIKKLLTISK